MTFFSFRSPWPRPQPRTRAEARVQERDCASTLPRCGTTSYKLAARRQLAQEGIEIFSSSRSNFPVL